MIYDQTLKGEKVYLRTIELSDCTETYLNWLNDKEVNQYLETRWTEQTIEKIKDFVQSIRESSHSYLFAVIFENKHVGNIKIGPIHPIYKCADVSYFIGDKTVWGKGIATEAIKLVTDFGFNVLGLNKLSAGAYENNIGSRNALLKNHYRQEGVFRKKYFLTSPDNYCDLYEFGILKSDLEQDKYDE